MANCVALRSSRNGCVTPKKIEANRKCSTRLPKPPLSAAWGLATVSALSKAPGPMANSKPIFVAATRQHAGKTTVSLALMSGLKKRFGRVGFIKPVGQQHITLTDEQGRDHRVDKDVQVLKEYFQLDHIDYSTMSAPYQPSPPRHAETHAQLRPTLFAAPTRDAARVDRQAP